MKKKVILLLVFIGILRFIIPIFQNRHLYTEPFDPSRYERKYNSSQYMIPQSSKPISDEELLTHAGYQYVLGVNPILINPDHPPLGKYIIGFFTVLFNNNRIVSVVFLLLNISVVITLIYSLTSSPFLTSLGFFFLSFDPMLIDQCLHAPMLDIIQVFFFLLYVYILFLNMKKENKLLALLMGLSLGMLSSIKLYFPALVALTVTLFTYILLKKNTKKILTYLIIVTPTMFFTYAATYFNYFIKTGSFFSFFGVQKWIFLFWQNNSIDRSKVFANIVLLILFNKWKVWWGNIPYLSYDGWSIVWPVFFVLSFGISIFILYQAVLFYLVKSKKTKQMHPLFSPCVFLGIWFIIFFVYLCFIPISPRYLMMLYIPAYILNVLFLPYFFQKAKYEKHR